MVIGNREESFEDMRQRHIKETLDHKIAWEKEYEIAKQGKNEQIMCYCNMWIKICDNTLNELNREE